MVVLYQVEEEDGGGGDGEKKKKKISNDRLLVDYDSFYPNTLIEYQ